MALAFRCGALLTTCGALFCSKEWIIWCCASILRSFSTASKIKRAQQSINEVENNPVASRLVLGPTAAPILRFIESPVPRDGSGHNHQSRFPANELATCKLMRSKGLYNPSAGSIGRRNAKACTFW